VADFEADPQNRPLFRGSWPITPSDPPNKWPVLGVIGHFCWGSVAVPPVSTPRIWSKKGVAGDSEMRPPDGHFLGGRWPISKFRPPRIGQKGGGRGLESHRSLGQQPTLRARRLTSTGRRTRDVLAVRNQTAIWGYTGYRDVHDGPRALTLASEHRLRAIDCWFMAHEQRRVDDLIGYLTANATEYWRRSTKTSTEGLRRAQRLLDLMGREHRRWLQRL